MTGLRISGLGISAAVVAIVGFGAEPPAGPPTPKDPMRIAIENALKPLKERPKPKSDEAYVETERLGQEIAVRIAGLGPKAPDMLLAMALEKGDLVPAPVLVAVLKSQPKRIPEWVDAIGPKFFSKAYREGEYWCYVFHQLDDIRAVKYMIPLLEHRTGPVGKVILALTERRGDMQPLRDFLDDKESPVRAKAEVVVMLSYGSKPALCLPLLLNALKDPDLAIRQEAVKALGNLGLQGREPPIELSAFLADEDTKLRRWTARTDAILGLFSFIPQIIPLLSDSNKSLQEDARANLTQLAGQDFGSDPEVWKRWWNNLGSKFGSRMEETWKARKAAQTPEAKCGLLKTLAEIAMLRDPRIEEMARESIADSDPGVRAAACRVFMAMAVGQPAPRGLASVVETLTDGDMDVVRAAYETLLKHSKQNYPPDYTIWKDWLLRRDAIADIYKLVEMGMYGYRPKEEPMEVPRETLDVVNNMRPSNAAAKAQSAAAARPPAEAAQAVPTVRETEIQIATNEGSVDMGKWAGVAVIWLLLVAAGASFVVLYRRTARERTLAKPRRAR